MVWVNVEPTLAILDDLTGSTIAGGKGGQATRHGLNYSQAKSLVQGRLHSTAQHIIEQHSTA
jgi:hypothetical protein